MDFKTFAALVDNKIKDLSKQDMLIANVDNDVLWNLYLDSFPEGTNPIYRERREYDCSCCKDFFRNMGNVITVKNGQVDTIWNIAAEYPFDVVASALHEHVVNAHIKNVFLTHQAKHGLVENRAMFDDVVVKFNHFHGKVPNKFVSSDIPEKQGDILTSIMVFQRGLEELSMDALNTVVGLIDDDMLYRGAEHRKSVVAFRNLKKKYDKLNSDHARNLFLWEHYKDRAMRFRNTVIGSLVIDLSNGVGIEDAVRMFESKVAPHNYKRSKSIITKKMVEDAMKTIDKIGYRESLKRRHARASDVSVNDVLFANRKTQDVMKHDEIADLLMSETSVKRKPGRPKSYKKVSIDTFIDEVLPKVKDLEVLVENKHVANMMNVIAPVNENAKNMLKWDNNFTWSYANNATDSDIRDRVKSAGGNVDAKLRVSLSWNNTDDLDIHAHYGSTHIYFGNRKGILDVDMNAGGRMSSEPVENLAWKTVPSDPIKIVVDQFCKRNNSDGGFTVEVEYEGEIHQFHYAKNVNSFREVSVVTIKVDDDGIHFSNVSRSVSTDTSVLTQNVWGIQTNDYVPVDMVMLSPNYWGDQEVGNKHWFFILDGCKNDEPIRGFYNEFLSEDLKKHRKVFEVLGDKMKCEPDDDQLAGLGFSSTLRNQITVKADGRPMTIDF